MSSLDTIKTAQVTIDRSPEFCLKRLIYRYILKTGHAPDDPPGVAIFVPRAIFGANFNMVH